MARLDPIVPASAREASAAFAAPHRHIDLPGGRLAYWRFGRGPDVVLVHGWPLHSATFRALVPLLAPRFTLHLVDLPGAGHTEWTGPIGIAEHAVTIRRAVDALGLDRYALLAHDSGGAIARLVAAEDPRVRGLVLGNTEIPGHTPWLVKVYCAAAKTPALGALLVAGLHVGVVRRSFVGFGGCFTDARFVDGEFGDWFIRPMLTSRRVAEGQMALAKTLDFELMGRLDRVHARITAPTLCVWGPEDPFFPIAKARRMLPQFRGGAELVEIPGAKLFAHEDHAEEYARHAVPFLGRCLAAETPEIGAGVTAAGREFVA
jgi:pimeloyl-ACP methyl ester carboxylesterase